MRERWGETLLRDPFYSRHFSLDKQPFFDLVDASKRDRGTAAQDSPHFVLDITGA